MKNRGTFTGLTILLILLSAAFAQNQAAVPRLMNYSGRATGAQGKTISGVAGVTFAIYSEQTGGAPLWIETQSVSVDAKGSYTAQLGAASSAGLPLDLFTSGGARWLGVRVNGGEEQARVLLLSVPYALKAADAETIGGLPPSAFLLAAPIAAGGSLSASSSEAPPTASLSPSLSGSGTTDYMPLWTSSSALGNSILFQTGSGSSGKIGINSITPAATLDVNGGVTIRGLLNLTPAGTAKASAGVDSRALGLVAATYNSSTQTAANQVFHWQAEPVGNNTASPSATLNLLFATAPATATETGLVIASNGQIHFAPGQTFPGTGPGTITGVTAGTGLTGGGGSGTVTLNLDTTKVPQLAAANTFTGNQTVNGNLSATGLVTGSGFNIGSALFAFGSAANSNAFLGFAGNSTLTGTSNTATGSGALVADTSGYNNVAYGSGALASNTVGSENTAIGMNALFNDLGNVNTAVGYGAGQTPNGAQVIGELNLFLGYNAGTSTTSPLTEATAIGSNSVVGESYAIVLGGTRTDAINVGIGTATPFNDYALDVEATTFSQINSGEVVNAGGGNLYLGMTNGVHKFRVDTNGVVYADGGFQSSGADFAESMAVHGSKSLYEPGDLLVIERGAHRSLTLSHTPYSTLVAGIYSTKPGLLATPHSIADPTVATSEVPLAVVGIVPCKVTAENGGIAAGDLLVTSSRAGYAMKGTDRRRMLGAVVGKALEPLTKGTGTIDVLVTMQ